MRNHGFIRFISLLIVLVAAGMVLGAPARAQSHFDSAQFIEQKLPDHLDVGETGTVEIKVKNVGNMAWTSQRGIGLIIQAPAPGQSWGASRIGVPQVVEPGEETTFKFKISAPRRPDTYQFVWSLGRENTPITGIQAPPAVITVNDPFAVAEFVGQLVPNRLELGEPFKVMIQYRNGGKAAWNTNQGYKLVPLTENAKRIWGVTEIAMEADASVVPGDIATFTVKGRAPIKPGEYDFQWQMYQGDRQWFGEPSPKVTIVVGSSYEERPELDLQAAPVSVDVPLVMKGGETYAVTIEFRNTGKTPWRYQQVTLISQNPDENLTWLINRIDLSSGETIGNGELKIFHFNIQAPSDPGMYPFQWRLTHDTAGPFGIASDNLMITVK